MGNEYQTSLYHFGIKGQKQGRRRFETEDGHLTEAGKQRYLNAYKRLEKKISKAENKVDKYERKSAERRRKHVHHQGKSGSNKFTRALLTSKYHQWRSRVNDVKQKKYEDKANRGRDKLKKLRSKLSTAKRQMTHSDTLSFTEIDEMLESMTDLDKTAFYCMIDDLLDETGAPIEFDSETDEEFKSDDEIGDSQDESVDVIQAE